jgi:hypothetical protein
MFFLSSHQLHEFIHVCIATINFLSINLVILYSSIKPSFCDFVQKIESLTPVNRATDYILNAYHFTFHNHSNSSIHFITYLKKGEQMMLASTHLNSRVKVLGLNPGLATANLIDFS